jgi:hypothetical protein
MRFLYRRRDFTFGLGAAAASCAAWSLAVRGQQPMPVVGFLAIPSRELPTIGFFGTTSMRTSESKDR